MGVCVLQAVNEMFKKSLSVLMDEFKPLANSVATMMIEMYETTPHASILDVARQVTKNFSLKNGGGGGGGGRGVLLLLLCKNLLHFGQLDQ